MKGTGITLASVLALFAAFAVNGKASMEALRALPGVISAFATGLPFGFASFLLALALACLTWIHAHRHFSYGKGGAPGRESRVTMLTLLVALAATLSQTIILRGNTAGQVLMALMLGILAGLLAPLLMQLATGAVNRSKAS